jgi:hypothetical protein
MRVEIENRANKREWMMRFDDLKSVQNREDQESYELTLWVEYNGKPIPLKDAYRAFTGESTKNEDLDSTRIAAWLERNGIEVKRA